MREITGQSLRILARVCRKYACGQGIESANWHENGQIFVKEKGGSYVELDDESKERFDEITDNITAWDSYGERTHGA